MALQGEYLGMNACVLLLTTQAFIDSNLHSLEAGWKLIYDATCKLVRNFASHVHVKHALTNGLIWSNMDLEEQPALCIESSMHPLAYC